MAKGSDAKFLEILDGEVAQNLLADFVLCESLGVFPSPRSASQAPTSKTNLQSETCECQYRTIVPTNNCRLAAPSISVSARVELKLLNRTKPVGGLGRGNGGNLCGEARQLLRCFQVEANSGADLVNSRL